MAAGGTLLLKALVDGHARRRPSILVLITNRSPAHVLPATGDAVSRGTGFQPVALGPGHGLEARATPNARHEPPPFVNSRITRFGQIRPGNRVESVDMRWSLFRPQKLRRRRKMRVELLEEPPAPGDADHGEHRDGGRHDGGCDPAALREAIEVSDGHAAALLVASGTRRSRRRSALVPCGPSTGQRYDFNRRSRSTDSRIQRHRPGVWTIATPTRRCRRDQHQCGDHRRRLA